MTSPGAASNGTGATVARSLSPMPRSPSRSTPITRLDSRSLSPTPPKPPTTPGVSSKLNSGAPSFTPAFMRDPSEPSSSAKKKKKEKKQQVDQEVEVTEEMKAAVLRQAEYYFSDENLSNDSFMQQQMAHGGELQVVSIHTITRFPKMWKLCPNTQVVAEILRNSEILGVDKRGRVVHRLERYDLPDPAAKLAEKFIRVEATNLPAGSTLDSLRELFDKCGIVDSVEMHKPDDEVPEDTPRPISSHGEYAICSFSKPEEAFKAVETLTDHNNWRSGMRVSLLGGVAVKTAQQKLAALRSGKVKKDGDECHHEGHHEVHHEGGHAGNTHHEEGGHAASSEANGSIFTGKVAKACEGDENGLIAAHSNSHGRAKTNHQHHWKVKLEFNEKDVEEGGPLQKGDHVRYRGFKDHNAKWHALQICKIDGPRKVAGGGGSHSPKSGHISPASHSPRRHSALQGRKSVQQVQHVKTALGPQEGERGFGAGRGRPIDKAYP